ncbi:nucleotidyl transferase AbiEii/AbiGii toxin family protein [bacterium]|nr:nucleotidyl transferase AbiEii/AbiGii toxin family protein [bacterium]
MNISAERLTLEAEATGFDVETLETVAHLLELLNALKAHPFLNGKLALKGGTALNLFILDVPRLSVDIDLNYVSEENRKAMLEERPDIVQAMRGVFNREGFDIRHEPKDYAGGRWRLQYRSPFGQKRNLFVDVNYMYRVPLWPLKTMDSKVLGAWQAKQIRIVDLHELAAGKLAALLSRHQARDLFDSNQILRAQVLDQEKLRVAFVVYGAMSTTDWREVIVEDVMFTEAEIENDLLPCLRKSDNQEQARGYGARLVNECKESLDSLLPLQDNELKFFNLILEEGKIDSSLLTEDGQLQDRISRHPSLLWKVKKVR